MLILFHGSLLSGFGHGGMRHGGTWGIHLLEILLLMAATVVFAAAATAGVSEWVQRRWRREDSTRLAGWVTFVIVFGLFGWLTIRAL